MSQKSSPRSPRTPRSKSASCDDGQPDGAENVPTADEIQEAVAEELRSPDRIMSQGQQSMRSRGGPTSYMSGQGRASYQGATPQSRVSYHPSVSSRPPTAPPSRIPSPRAASTYEEEPGPPVSPNAYGSRAASLGMSRAASPEVASHMSKPTSYADVGPEPNEDYCPDDGGAEGTYTRGPSQQPSMRTTPAPSQPSTRGSQPYSRQPSMRESPAYSHPSMRGSPVYSHPSMREGMGPSQPSMREGMGPSQPSMREGMGPSQPSMRQGPSMMGPSKASVRGPTSACSSMREGTLPSNRGTPSGSCGPAMGTGAGPSAVTFGNRESMPYVQDAPSSLTQRTGNVPESLACSRQTFRDADVGMSGIGLNASGFNQMGGVDVGTSVMSYAAPNDRTMASCVPGCKTFMRDIQNAASSTPYAINQDNVFDQPSAMFERSQSMPPSSIGGKTPQHKMMSHESGYHTLSGQGHTPSGPGHTLSGPAPAATFTIDRSATPSSYMRSPSPADDEHHHHHEGHEGLPGERDERVVAALGHLSQFKKTPSYFRCGLGDEMDFLKICGGNKGKEPVKTAPGKVAVFPEIPCLRQEDLDELIKCEAADVDSAWYLTSDERKTYKKPCPKQQKAQMSVKALVQAHAAQTCGKEYSPLEHPDPEDISPEVAAAMMFSQERGIKMEECPNYTITSLFPDEPKPPFPEKIPASSISIVDRNSKDQEEMIEKSADVPSEGVSDSAYTRTMKEKGSEDMGAQRSFDVDFAIGQSKREYVLVAQKPQRVNKVQYRGGNSPPWFPGYFSAFPNEEGIKMVTSPSDLLHKAWVHSNPGNMPTSDVIVLE